MIKHRAQLLLMSAAVSREELSDILQHAVEWAHDKYSEDYPEGAIESAVIDDMEDEDV